MYHDIHSFAFSHPFKDNVFVFSHPFWNKVSAFSHPLWDKISAFSHPFWNKVSAFSHPFLDKVFCLFRIQKTVHGKLKNNPPQQQQKQGLTLSSPWSVGFAAEKNVGVGMDIEEKALLIIRRFGFENADKFADDRVKKCGA